MKEEVEDTWISRLGVLSVKSQGIIANETRLHKGTRTCTPFTITPAWHGQLYYCNHKWFWNAATWEDKAGFIHTYKSLTNLYKHFNRQTNSAVILYCLPWWLTQMVSRSSLFVRWVWGPLVLTTAITFIQWQHGANQLYIVTTLHNPTQVTSHSHTTHDVVCL